MTLEKSGIHGPNWGIAFHLGSLPIRWYGILIIIGFFIAAIAAFVKLKYFYKLKGELVFNLLLIVLPVGLISASFYSWIIGNSNSPIAGITGGGGLAIQGGIIGAVIAGMVYFRHILKKPANQILVSISNDQTQVLRQVSMLTYADAIIPTILIGQVIGRWGNFLNYEVYGQVVNPNVSYNDAQSKAVLEWLRILMHGVWINMWIGPKASSGINEPKAKPWFDGSQAKLPQPLFLYESFAFFIGFIALYFVFDWIKNLKAGTIAFSYFAYTGLIRMIMEIFRESQYRFVESIVLSSLFFIFGLTAIFLNQLVMYRFRHYKLCLMFWGLSQCFLDRLNNLVDKQGIILWQIFCRWQKDERTLRSIKKINYSLNKKFQLAAYKRKTAEKLYFLDVSVTWLKFENRRLKKINFQLIR